MSVKPLNIKKDISAFFPDREIDMAQEVAKLVSGPEADVPAKYKIEVMFSRHRSSLLHKPSVALILIWESGKELHGGGDSRMQWCGYSDCDKPLSSDLFGIYSVVCPHCGRESFLDPHAKQDHVAKSPNSDMRRMPVVYGERGVNLTPGGLATIIERIFHSLDNNANVVLKYSPYAIRMDPKNITPADMEMLKKTRGARKIIVYTLKSILKDTMHGGDLKKRIVSFLTA